MHVDLRPVEPWTSTEKVVCHPCCNFKSLVHSKGVHVEEIKKSKEYSSVVSSWEKDVVRTPSTPSRSQ